MRSDSMKRKRGLRATDALRFRHAEATGEVVSLTLQIGIGAPVWWKWTTGLAMALQLRSAVLR